MYVDIIHPCFSFYDHSITFHFLFLAFVTVVHRVSFFACVMSEHCCYLRYRDSRYFILYVIIIILYFGNVKYEFVLTVFPKRQNPDVFPFWFARSLSCPRFLPHSFIYIRDIL